MPNTGAWTHRPGLVSRCLVENGGVAYASVLRIHAREVDLGCKLDLGRLVGVVRAAMNRNAVDAVLVDALRW